MAITSHQRIYITRPYSNSSPADRTARSTPWTMCGFAGIVTTASLRREALEAIAESDERPDRTAARMTKDHGPNPVPAWRSDFAG